MGSGGSTSRPSTADGNQSEEDVEEKVQKVLSLHAKGKEHNSEKQFLRQSMSKSKLQVRLQKRQSQAALRLSGSGGDGGDGGDGGSATMESGATEETELNGASFFLVKEKTKKSKKKKKDKKDRKDKKDKKEKKDSKKDSKSDKKKKHKKSKKNKNMWPSEIPRNGVTIRFLQQILGRVKPEMSSSNVCHGLVKPDTANSQVPYTHMLETEKRADYHGNSFVGPATHFVSYCQDEPFDQLVSALDVFVNLSGSNPGKVFFWLDIFSLNQHTSSVSITHDWLRNSLPSAIGALHQFVLITPPQEPKALTRSWCLWELYNALQNDCHIHVHTSGKLYGDFQNMMLKKKTFKALIAKFGTEIDCINSGATDSAHGVMLKSCFKGVGIDKANHLISQCTRSWLATKGDEMVDRLLRSSSKGEDGKKDRKQALDACVLVAGIWKDLDRLDKAEPSYRRVLELRENLLGKDHHRTIKSMQNLASLLQALNLRTKAKKGWSALAGSLKKRSSRGISNVNYLAEAELLFRRALVKQEQVLGLTAPETLQSINNFAVFCQKNQKLREAELLYRRALQGFEQAHGKGHGHTLQAGHNLASLLQEQGETLQAEEMYRTVYEGRVAVHGGEDPRTLQTFCRLGTVLQLMGNIGEAESIFQQLVTMHNDVQGGDAAETFHAMSMLASCMIDAQHSDDAEPLLRSVYAGRKLKFGENDIDTLQAASDLANFCYTEGKMIESESLYKLVFAGQKSLLGKRHLTFLKTVTKLAAVYFAQNNLAEAEKLYMQAYEGYKRKVGVSDPCTMLCVDMLARLLLKQNKFDLALPFYETAYNHYSSTLGTNHQDSLNMMGFCGICLQSLGRVNEGNTMLLKCVDDLNKGVSSLDSDSPLVPFYNKRIVRFQKAYQEGQAIVESDSERESKTNTGLESKQDVNETRTGAWTKSSRPNSPRERRHFKPTGIGVNFANRLGKFTPTRPSSGGSIRPQVVAKRGPRGPTGPRGPPPGAIPRGNVPRKFSPKPPPPRKPRTKGSV